jgi:release factor glutamine methyltransferase
VRADELWEEGTRILSGAGIPRPRWESLLLLTRASSFSRERVLAHPETEIEESAQTLFRNWVKRRAGREPLAYILGEAEFMSRTFLVTPACLIPRPETELLVEVSGEFLASSAFSEGKVADVGTGSGVIAVTLALSFPSLTVYATDLSPEALEVARQNARLHGVEERIIFLAGDLLDALPSSLRGSLLLLVSNPPYVREGEWESLLPEVRREPREALVAGPRGTEVIERLVFGAREFLLPGGMLALEMGLRQGPAVRSFLRRAGYSRWEVRRDYAGRERVVLAWL